MTQKTASHRFLATCQRSYKSKPSRSVVSHGGRIGTAQLQQCIISHANRKELVPPTTHPPPPKKGGGSAKRATDKAMTAQEATANKAADRGATVELLSFLQKAGGALVKKAEGCPPQTLPTHHSLWALPTKPPHKSLSAGAPHKPSPHLLLLVHRRPPQTLVRGHSPQTCPRVLGPALTASRNSSRPMVPSQEVPEVPSSLAWQPPPLPQPRAPPGDDAPAICLPQPQSPRGDPVLAASWQPLCTQAFESDGVTQTGDKSFASQDRAS
jgi:hypothetical protein